MKMISTAFFVTARSLLWGTIAAAIFHTPKSELKLAKPVPYRTKMKIIIE
jgi:hypothetical protein